MPNISDARGINEYVRHVTHVRTHTASARTHTHTPRTHTDEHTRGLDFAVPNVGCQTRLATMLANEGFGGLPTMIRECHQRYGCPRNVSALQKCQLSQNLS